MKLLRRLALIALLLLGVPFTFARLGETEAELIQRFGKPGSQSQHFVFTQGKMQAFGPALFFRQDDWSIQCDLVDGRCMRISYSKPGDWSGDQIMLVLSSNAQGAKWTENSKPSIASIKRTWLRVDGSTATWQKGAGMSLVWDAYNTAKAKFEEREKVASKKKPKI
jgi:hypothetical protein